MDWFELTLPDGSMPWVPEGGADADGKLFVDVKELQTALPDGGTGRVFHFDLYVFLPDQVIKLGSLERK